MGSEFAHRRKGPALHPPFRVAPTPRNLSAHTARLARRRNARKAEDSASGGDVETAARQTEIGVDESAFAVTENGRTRLSAAAQSHPRRREIEAHEAVHRAQFAVHGIRPTGSVEQLEAEATQATETVVSGHAFTPVYGAAPGLALHFDPAQLEGPRPVSLEQLRSEAQRAGLDLPSPPSPEVEADVQEQGDTAQTLTVHDASDVEWTPDTSNDVITIFGGGVVAVLPAREYLHRGARGGKPPSTRRPHRQRRPVYGMTGVGHGGLQLLNTGSGVALQIDAGGAQTDQIRAILPGSLLRLKDRLQVNTIAGVLLTHTHTDHFQHLLPLIKAGVIKGSDVWMWPGLEKTTRGALHNLLQELRKPEMESFGFGPRWSPKAPKVREVPGPAGGVTVGEMTIGTAKISMVTRTRDLRAHQDSLKTTSGSAKADPSSMLTRIRLAGTNFHILIVGDLRGLNLEQIAESMGEGGEVFRQYVSRATVVTGMHHLGKVKPEDVPGHRRLVQSLPADRPVTIVAQTSGQPNQRMIEGLTAGGFDVVVLSQPKEGEGGAAEQSFTVSETGKVRTRGASVHRDASSVARAQSRLRNLRAAAEVLQHSPEIVLALGALPTGTVEGLKKEAERLEKAILKRRRLGIEGVTDKTRPADYDKQLKRIDAELRAVRGAEKALGAPEVRRIARYQTYREELQRQLESARRRGYSNPRFAALLREVDPTTAGKILSQEGVGRPRGRRAQRRALRRAIARLEKQVEIERAFRGGAKVGKVGKGVAYFLIALELARGVVEPMVAAAAEKAHARKRFNVYEFLKIGFWWAARRTPIPLVLRNEEGTITTQEELNPSLAKRIWKDTPYEQKTKPIDLPEEVKEASPLTIVYVPAVERWPDKQRVFDRFRDWVSVNIQDTDDYETWFGDENVAVRPTGAGDFTKKSWELRVGEMDEDDNVAARWEPSSELTTIMQTTAQRVVFNTKEHQRLLWQLREAPKSAPPSPPTISAMPSGSRRRSVRRPTGIGRPIGFDRPTQRMRFRDGKAHQAYGPVQLKPARVTWWNDHPEFLVFGNHASPEGFVWVMGADYNTQGAIRAAEVYAYDPAETVDIPPPDQKHLMLAGGLKPRWEDYMTREQVAARRLAQREPDVVYIERNRMGGVSYGEVRFYEWGSNIRGALLVRTDDLEPLEK